MSEQNPPHRYGYEQFVEPLKEIYPRRVQIVALVPGCCATHRAPMYGCVAGDNHFTFCEESLKPLSSTAKRKMN